MSMNDGGAMVEVAFTFVALIGLIVLISISIVAIALVSKIYGWITRGQKGTKSTKEGEQENAK